MHYCLYLPRVTGFGPELLADVGLAALVDPHCATRCTEVAGEMLPDRGSGVLAHWTPTPPDLSDHWTWYAGKRQTTDPPPSSLQPQASFYLGWPTDAPPTPRDLERRDRAHSLPVRLADGQEWLIPVASYLPTVWTLGDDGTPRKTVEQRERGYFDEALRLVAAVHERIATHGRAGLEDYQWQIGGEWDFCIASLSRNYRVNADVVDALQLLRHFDALAVIAAAGELHDLAQIVREKKKAHDALIDVFAVTSPGDTA